MTTHCYWVVGFIALIAFVCGSSVALSGDDNDLDLLLEVAQRDDASIRSGVFDGQFRWFRKDKVNGELASKASGKLSACFDGSRYRVDLRYDRDTARIDRRVIIFDGNVLASSYFSARVSITGATAEIFRVGASPSGIVNPQQAEFPWDVSKLHREAVYLPTLIDNIGRQAINCRKSSMGDIIVVYKVGRTGTQGDVELTYRREDGYHLGKFRYTQPDGQVALLHELGWQKVGDVWWIKSFIEDSAAAEARWELDVGDVSLNRKIAETNFLFRSLDLPDGSRVIDRTTKRPVQDGKSAHARNESFRFSTVAELVFGLEIPRDG